ncbi:Transcriptional regulatory protein WalR [bioreactor metagenome]|uniref:Transcriptional regulatory protein WalR n=1 Tax=bioreactor metagenome TaxID=1076179 RepID=A0A645CC70_9ZZZZ
MKKAIDQSPDIILLDVMLPVMDGFDVCREIRKKSDTPIIMLTAREEETDKVLGLELGADDYITKPFSMRELLARIKANVRRSKVTNASAEEENKKAGNLIQAGPLTIDTELYIIKKDGKSIDLTVREYELLKYLVAQNGKVFSREELLKNVWGYEYYGDVRTVDVTVRRLREKIESNSADPALILTKRGLGYYFCKL